jgi:hypothetical protein
VLGCVESLEVELISSLFAARNWGNTSLELMMQAIRLIRLLSTVTNAKLTDLEDILRLFN